MVKEASIKNLKPVYFPVNNLYLRAKTSTT